MFKQLQDMALFALVAERGSFTAAANEAGLPKSSVSLRISQLEQQVGLRLLNRTTRKINLTFAGERYLVHCREMIDASERAEFALQRLRDNPSGRLRITCPAGIGATLLARMNTQFQRCYPEVMLEVSVSDELIDLVESGYDVALRTGKPLRQPILIPILRLNTPVNWPSINVLSIAHGMSGCCKKETITIVVRCPACTPPIIFSMRVNAPWRGRVLHYYLLS